MKEHFKRLNSNEKVKGFYYACKKCGRQIDSEEYYTYGVCYLCRW